MKHHMLLITILISLLALTGCAPAATIAPEPTLAPVSGRLTFAGSTTVQPLAAILAKKFQEQNPNLQMEIAAGGSSVGIQAVHDGTADIGMASRSLKPEEAEGIQVYQIAIDALIMVVHPDNPVTDVSVEQLKEIYLGAITSWSALGGVDQPITVVVRDVNSGSRGAFDEIVLDKEEPTAPNLKSAITAGDVVALVSADPAAIGYIGLGNVDDTIKVIQVDGTTPSKETLQSGAYSLSRPLQLLTGPLSQPLATVFIEYSLSDDGQQMVEEAGWVSFK